MRDFESGTADFIVRFEGLPAATPAGIVEAVGRWKTGVIRARITSRVTGEKGVLRAGDLRLANAPKGRDVLARVRELMAGGDLVLAGTLEAGKKGGRVLVLSSASAEE